MDSHLSRSYLLVIATVSASALAYEVLLMRLFSIIQWHHFAYMIISLALLGYGVSGVFLALNRQRLTRHFPTVILAHLLCLSISMPACFLLAQQIPFNPAEILWDPVQLLYLCSVYLILTMPFFFAANVIGLSFYQYQQQVSSLYASDLLGAGAGSVGIIVLLFMMFPEKVLMVLLFVVLMSALLLSTRTFAQHINRKKWNSAIIVVAIGAMALLPDLGTLIISPYKSQNQFLTIPATRIIEQQSSPLGLISVVETKQMPLRHAPGMSINADVEPPEQLAVFTDGDNMSAITSFDGNLEPIRYLDQTTSALPYHLSSLSDVLILGAGTGSDILQARFHKVKHIDAVEQNPQIINLIKDRYADLAGDIYSSPEVTIHTAEARGFVMSSDKSYDLISISLMDAFGASAAGLYSMAENYLYTEQAIQNYLQNLSPDGYLTLTRWIKLPPRDMPKLLVMVSNVLEENYATDPAQQIMVIRSWQTSTLIVKNGSITAIEIAKLKQFCRERNFDLVFYPGINEQEANQFNILQQPYLYQAAVELLGDQYEAFIDSYKFNIQPATDDQPYFSQFFKWQTLPEIISLIDSGGLFLLESGYLLLIAALFQAIVASVLLIALPLWLWKHKLGIQSGSQQHKRVLVYFFCLGLAFLFIEIAFIQKFILILHHPLYAITLVLSAFLVTAGAGSYFSRTLSDSDSKLTIVVPVMMIAVLTITYMLNFDLIAAFLLQQADLTKYMLSILLIAPLGFCMGIPFPLALARLSQTQAELIPWAWGINGCASVISAILATLIAMQFGFSVLIMLAVMLYGAAAFYFPATKNDLQLSFH
ncbi:MAG: SAM-dependent methyltransferase [Gammaproteobacteria bacterium]|nr:SAM-dependent methyltransferase [Gammaproteobacteria bacterium]